MFAQYYEPHLLFCGNWGEKVDTNITHIKGTLKMRAGNPGQVYITNFSASVGSYSSQLALMLTSHAVSSFAFQFVPTFLLLTVSVKDCSHVFQDLMWGKESCRRFNNK